MGCALETEEKEAEYCENAARDEIPGMSGAWDWALKETYEALGSCMWLWAGSSREIKTGRLEDGDMIYAG